MDLLSSVNSTLRLWNSDINLSDDHKILNYSILMDDLQKISNSEILIRDKELQHSIFNIVNIDITDGSTKMQLLALNAMMAFLKCKRKDFGFDIKYKYFQLAFDDSTVAIKELQDVAFSCLELLVWELIMHKKLNLENIYVMVSNIEMQKKFVKLLEEACVHLPAKEKVTFFYETMIPHLFAEDKQQTRTICRQLICSLQPQMDISLLDKMQLKEFRSKILSYNQKIQSLLALQDPEWHHLYITLIYSCGKMLLTEVDIINLFLKTAEKAFRSRDPTTYIEGYNCWKAVIDIYSLDINYLSQSKYLGILVMPLRINISRDVRVTKKRLEIWLHLISNLKRKSATCLQHFLNFCFGAPGDSPFIQKLSIGSPNSGQLLLLQQVSTAALLEIMGHFDHLNESCFQYKDGFNFKLEEPIVTCEIFKIHEKIIINSIGECSLLIFKFLNKADICKVIKCLWGSLFNIIKELPQKEQKAALERVALLLGSYMLACKESRENLYYLLKVIIEQLLEKLFFSTEILNNLLIYPLLKNYIKYGDLTSLCNDEILVRCFCFGRNTFHEIDWFDLALEIFDKVKTFEHMDNLLQLWTEVFLIMKNGFSLENNTAKMDAEINFVIWPLLHAHELSLQQRKNCIEKWCNIFTDILKKFPDKASLVLKNLQLNIKLSQLPKSETVMEIFPYLCILMKEPDRKFLVDDALKVATEVFAVKLDESNQKLLLPIVKNLMLCLDDVTLTKISLQAFCNCCENVLTYQQIYDVLEILLEFFEKIPNQLITAVPSSLLKIIRGFTTHENKTFSHNAASIVIKYTKKLSSPKQCSRATRITNMAMLNETLKDHKPTPYISLFNDKANCSIQLRGSMIKDSPSKKVKKDTKITILNKSPVIDCVNEEANFVLIDEGYNFDPDKLTEHQIEKLKEKRSDIPALYQDLSQSQSGSQCFTKIVQDAHTVYNKKEATDTTGNDIKSGNDFKLPSFEKPNNIHFFAIKPDLPQSSTILQNPDSLVNKNSSVKNGTDKPKRRIPLVRVVDNSSPSLDNKVNNSDNFKIKDSRPDSDIQNSNNQNDTTHKDTTDGLEENLKADVKDTEKNLLVTKNMKLSRELNKIKLDIVGGDTYIQNLDLSEKRKTRKNNVNVHPGHIKNIKRRFIDSNKSVNPSNVSTDKRKSNKCKENLNNREGKDDIHNDDDTLDTKPVRRINKRKRLSLNEGAKNDTVNIVQGDHSVNVNKSTKLTTEHCDLKDASKSNSLDVEKLPIEEVGDNHVSNFRTTSEENITTDFGRNSEDVIESSQESYMDITLSPRKSTSIIFHNSEKVVTEPFTTSNQEDCVNVHDNIYASSQESEIRDLINNANICSPDQLIRLNLESDMIPTKDELDIAEMDTLSEVTDSIDQVNEIPSSPLCEDTPTRTKDFIENTINISPIRLFVDDEEQDKTEKTPELFDSEPCDVSTTNPVTEHLTENNKSPLKNASENLAETTNETTTYTPTSFSNVSVYNDSRAFKILKCLSQTLAPKTVQKASSDNKYKSINSPKSGRIVKMMKKYTSENSFQGYDFFKSVHVEEITESDEEEMDIPENQILRFRREIPSPTASPKYGILKRKAPDAVDEGFSPPRKKRVNFPDPPLTSQKIIIKDSNEHSKPFKEVHNIFDIAHEEIIETIDAEEISEPVIEDYECEVETESVNVHTQGSIDLIQTHLLEQDKPICSVLVDCTEAVEEIIQNITSPACEHDVLKELKNRQIVTIGDLAKLTEVEISRLPFKPPKVLLVQNALMQYINGQPIKKEIDVYKELLDDTGTMDNRNEIIELSATSEDCINDATNIFLTSEAFLEPPVQSLVETNSFSKVDKLNIIPKILQKSNSIDQIRASFEEIIAKAKKEGLQACLEQQLIEEVGVDVLTSVLVNSGELFKEERFTKMLNEILKHFGFTNLLICVLQLPNVSPQTIINTCLNEIIEKDIPLPSIMKLILPKVPINEVLEEFGLDHIIDGLYNMHKKTLFSVRDFFVSIMTRFNPNVQDIILSFRYINLVHVNGISVSLKNFEIDELNKFMQKVLGTDVNNEKTLHGYECEDFVNLLTTCKNGHKLIDNVKALLSKLPNDEDNLEPLMCAIIEKYSFGSVWRFVSNFVAKLVTEQHISNVSR